MTDASPATALAALEKLLAPGSVLPRRAVLLESGVVGDRADRPDLQEVPVLSAACEAVGAGLGRYVPSRNSGQLARECATGPATAEAWKALYNDVKTGDADFDAIAKYFAEDAAAPIAVVSALIEARDAAHLLHAACALGVVLPNVSEDARRLFGAAFGRRLPDFVTAFAAHSRFMRRELRDLALVGLGKLLVVGEVPLECLASLLEDILRARQDDLARLFVHCPCLAQCLQQRPGLLAALMDRCRKAPAARRYALLALLVKIAESETAAIDYAEVGRLAGATLQAMLSQGSLDARTTLVCAILVRRAATAGVCPVEVSLSVARALESSSAALCRSDSDAAKR